MTERAAVTDVLLRVGQRRQETELSGYSDYQDGRQDHPHRQRERDQ